MKVSSVEEHYYLMLLFTSKFKYISAGNLNTNIVYHNLECLMQTYFKSQGLLKKKSKNKQRNPKILWGRIYLEFAEKYLKLWICYLL